MNRSETITTISKALIEFQAKMVKVTKDSVNPHFGKKYASLSQIIEAVQKPLNDCGLAVIQMPTGDHELETTLIHTSGEYISQTYRMTPQRDDPQGLGSAITYQRRYALGAILCLNIDDDDDAEIASTPKVGAQTRTFDDGKVWLSEMQLDKILERFANGERDVIDKALITFKMKKEYRDRLLKASENVIIK